MFDRIKQWLGATGSASPVGWTGAQNHEVTEWAKAHGIRYIDRSKDVKNPKSTGPVGPAAGFELSGTLHDKVWHIECGLPSRDFISGQELRGRSEVGVLDTVAVVLINRPLKLVLEKRAYAMYTDTVQTIVDTKLPEEMRWLAIYPEVQLPSTSPAFLERYAVLASKDEHAARWVQGGFAQALMEWPASGPTAQVPFVMMLLRGRCYVRMEMGSLDVPTLQHLVRVFTLACQSAVDHVAQELTISL
jgi:hypothetical protein